MVLLSKPLRAPGALLVALAALGLPRPVLAWSNAGHMASGAIAYDTLAKRDPAALRAVLAILVHHPDAARFSHNLAGSSGPQRERLAFEWMARWPDDIRPTAWSHPEWHYQARVASGWTWFPYVAGKAASAWEENLAVARDQKRPAGERAIALCWLFHITGDIQQPLHAGHRMSSHFVLTDRLGTTAWVKPNAGDQPIELHQYWDHAAEDARIDHDQGDLAAANELAARAEAIAVPPVDHAAGLPPRRRFAVWTGESRILADTVAYQGAALEAGRNRMTAPVLGRAANAKAHALATIRIAQAGDRLAALLTGLR